ncbi:MAG: T9SS type A sorting domain-containing protein [Flavobacteriia bacterium]|nr:T9SS type A sorting domain-containing protein [Flavobacteriia bacterium]
MRRIIFFLFISLSFSCFSQKEKFSCSNVKQKHFHTKSNTLSLHQIKLTEKYDVNYYNLNLSMSNLSTYINGFVTIHAKSLTSLDTVLFELHQQLNVSTIELNNENVAFTRNSSAIIINTNIQANTSFSIKIFYEGTPPDAVSNPLGGSGMTNDFSPSWGNQVTWTLSEPFSAFEWFPVKQSLIDKADSVEVNITVPSNCKAGSNGILMSVTNDGNGNSTYHWKHNHPIDYYLISVAVAEYVDYSIYANPVGSDPVLIQNYVYNNPQTLPNFQQDIDETATFIELYSELFGLYPFADEKYGHCMAPLGGGMEHQTMTTQGYFEKSLTSHELAHQWWGDQVTCQSWADIWVNEGFASYSEYLMFEHLYPDEKEQDMLNRHDYIMSEPNGSIYVLDSLNGGRIFSGRLTYDKGAAFIHTLRYIINNDELFFEGLRNYQQSFKNKTALGIDVQASLESASGVDLSAAFEEWYFGEGFPTYNVTWNYENYRLHLKVEQNVSAGNITPLFTTPLEIKCRKSNFSDTIIRMELPSQTTIFSLPTGFPITTVLNVDPNNWIVNGTGTIQKDETFFAETSIFENNEEGIIIYPNPTSDLISIKGLENKKCKFSLIQPDGKTMNIGASNSIDLTSYSAGIYVLFIEELESKKQYRKIIKKK